MKTPRAHGWIQLLLGAALLLTPALAAQASDFQVNPVRLTLDEKTRTGLLAIVNSSPDSVRLQISIHAWAQDTQGKATLSKTEELSYFPSLLTLEPGQSRNIRVGTPLGSGLAEKAYRIIVEQLPPSVNSSGGGSQIHVLTRMSIPVFVAPDKPSRQTRIEDLELMDGTVSFSLHNTGNSHVFARQARIQGMDADGTTLVDTTQAGWYVLAGDERQFSLALPQVVCRRLKRLLVEVTTDAGTLPATTVVSGERCGT